MEMKSKVVSFVLLLLGFASPFIFGASYWNWYWYYLSLILFWSGLIILFRSIEKNRRYKPYFKLARYAIILNMIITIFRTLYIAFLLGYVKTIHSTASFIWSFLDYISEPIAIMLNTLFGNPMLQFVANDSLPDTPTTIWFLLTKFLNILFYAFLGIIGKILIDKKEATAERASMKIDSDNCQSGHVVHGEYFYKATLIPIKTHYKSQWLGYIIKHSYKFDILKKQEAILCDLCIKKGIKIICTKFLIIISLLISGFLGFIAMAQCFAKNTNSNAIGSLTMLIGIILIGFAWFKYRPLISDAFSQVLILLFDWYPDKLKKKTVNIAYRYYYNSVNKFEGYDSVLTQKEFDKLQKQARKTA